MYRVEGAIVPNHKPLSKHVLGTALVIYDFMRRGLTPSYGRLAKHRGVDLTTLKAHMKTLKAFGLEQEAIKTPGGQRLGTRYRWPVIEAMLNGKGGK